MRLWQSLMISLARNGGVTSFMHNSQLMRGLSRQFVGGDDLQSALERMTDLDRKELRGSLFYLGEYVDSPELVHENVEALEAAIPALAATTLDLHVSVDPTQIGAQVSWNMCRDNALRLASRLRDAASERDFHGVRPVLMLDMEDAGVTEPTLELYHWLREQGLPVGITIQSYLHRSSGDIERLIATGGFVRLVKGAFAESADIARTDRRGRDETYRLALERLFSQQARKAGVYPAVGSHDHAMIEEARILAARNGWSDGQWEVEMLLGVRPDYQRILAAQGVRVRLYVPFGRQWWPYSIRRVGETPRNLTFVLRSLM